jgi:hypothetical protein
LINDGGNVGKVNRKEAAADARNSSVRLMIAALKQGPCVRSRTQAISLVGILQKASRSEIHFRWIARTAGVIASRRRKAFPNSASSLDSSLSAQMTRAEISFARAQSKLCA